MSEYLPGFESLIHIEPRLCDCGKYPERQNYTGYSEIWCDRCGAYVTTEGNLNEAGWLWNRRIFLRSATGRFIGGGKDGQQA